MKSKWFFIAASVLLFSCSKTPKGVLDKKQMVSIIIDLNLLEGSMSVANISWVDSEKKKAYYNYVFEKHGVTPAQLDSSFVWYAQNPKELEIIYLQVNEKLTNLQENSKQ